MIFQNRSVEVSNSDGGEEGWCIPQPLPITGPCLGIILLLLEFNILVQKSFKKCLNVNCLVGTRGFIDVFIRRAAVFCRGQVYITIIPWARVGHNHFISNKGEWNNCFSKFSNRVLPPIFISTILQSVRKENLAHYFPYDVKLRLLAHSQSFLANQKARNAIVLAENLLIIIDT